MPTSGSIEKSCETPQQLLNALSLRGEFFCAAAPRTWAFRGQANATWELTPSAFRADSANGLHARTERPWERWSNADQIQAEAETLRQFIAEADGAGLAIPQQSHELREQIDQPFGWKYPDLFESGKVEWPPRIIWPTAALAQHYGLPTRFLDWSYSPFVAAYFAARGALETHVNPPRSFAVWAVLLIARGMNTLPVREANHKSVVRFPTIVVAPYADNPNLRAQEGLHLADTASSLKWIAPADRSSMDPPLKFPAMQGFSKVVSLRKFTLATEHAPELLWHLGKEGVTASRLFPGYYGAARGVREQLLRRQPP
jgi:FRG domain